MSISDKITVESGFKIAVRHPYAGAEILAKTLAKALVDQDWITEEFKLKFCIMFVDNLIDGNIEKNINRKFLDKIKQKPFTEGIRLMKKRPDQGMKFMLVIIMEELRHRQGFTEKEQFTFYDELLTCFFPEYKVEDFIN